MLLRRQLRKAGLSEANPPTDAAAWRAFLERVERTYQDAELDRYTMERSLMISSKEMQGLHDELRRELMETRRLEEQLRQSQKMEAVGQLAGGIAHDFNNLLSAILGYANLILDDLPPDHPMREDVAEIRKAGERAAKLTRQLLAFSRKQVLQPKTIDLSRVVSDMRGMLHRLVGEGIALTLTTDTNLRTVHADPNQIEQVILNLVVNARDALMHTAGEIRIETANVDVPPVEATINNILVGELKPGRYVTLTVRDNGMGMDPSTIARIFEPFFTTKDVGKGTGLGLSTVFGIIKQSGAHITVESEPGSGSLFRISFPCNDQHAGAAASSVAPTASHPPSSLRPQGGDEIAAIQFAAGATILVVEDEDQVRGVTIAALRKQGYNVLEAQNAGEAFLICEMHRARIDLMLTDVVMPRMSGPDLAARVASMRPEMKIVFMSGYPRNALDPNALEVGVAFLEKPLTPESLKKRIREVLTIPSIAPSNNVEIHQVH